MKNTEILDNISINNISNVSFYGLTDKGRKRKHNEDNFYCSKELGLFIVCDGIGGHQAGEKASELAVTLLPEYFSRLSIQTSNPQKTDETIKSESRAIIREVNRKVYSASSNKKEYKGMGCTVVSAFIHRKYLYIANLGDSRAYLLRKNLFKQITLDHSLVGNLVFMGRITPFEARRHPMKHIITRHLGAKENMDPDIFRIPFLNGDRLILATDGLTDMVSDMTIAKALSRNKELKDICTDLVRIANNNGGEDNITVVALQKGNFNAQFYKNKPRIRFKHKRISAKTS